MLPKLLNYWPTPSVPSHLSVLTTASTSGMLALWEIALSSFSSWLFRRRYLFLEQDSGRKTGWIEEAKMQFHKKQSQRPTRAAGLGKLLSPGCSLYQASQLQFGKTSSKIYQMPLPALTSFEMMVLCWLVWHLMVCKYIPLDNAHCLKKSQQHVLNFRWK